MSRTSLVLGVDGGGTKSIGLISDLSGNILSRREVGATNPNVVGLEASADNLFRLISKCCEDVRCPPFELRSVVLGLAGAGDKEFREQIKESVNALFAKNGSKSLRIHVESDARVALEGAFDGGPGVVIISGTGSIVMGKTLSGDVHTVGGWGRILGDEGSGYSIGRDGVRAVTLEYDGRGDSTKLKELLATNLQWTTRESIIKAVYREQFDLAKVAPFVMEAAMNHDAICQKILQNAASQFIEQIRVIVMKMGLFQKIGLVMCGGLFEHSTVFSNVLKLKIMKGLPQVEVRQASQSPAHGAVRMAISRVRTK